MVACSCGRADMGWSRGSNSFRNLLFTPQMGTEGGGCAYAQTLWVIQFPSSPPPPDI